MAIYPRPSRRRNTVPVGSSRITDEGALEISLSERIACLAVISPVRDEEATIRLTLDSMLAQTMRPSLWVIVDDGSKDETPRILEEAASQHSWIRWVAREDRGHRAVGRGVVEAFYEGLRVVDASYDFIGKLDGDVVLSPTYIERIMERFDADPKLAAASGKIFQRRKGHLVEEFMIDGMVAGAFKIYRRSVFEEIGGFVPGLMWDGIAFHRTRTAGYRSASFSDPELRIEELRPMGTSDGSVYRGRLRHGRGQWFMGSTFPYVVTSGVFRMRERPYIIGGLLMIAGYIAGALSGLPRYEHPGFRAELRRWQWQRLWGALRGRGIR